MVPPDEEQPLSDPLAQSRLIGAAGPVSGFVVATDGGVGPGREAFAVMVSGAHRKIDWRTIFGFLCLASPDSPLISGL